MSATRDKSQKVTFVYSNLYQVYRKGVERAREGAIQESAENSPSRAAEALTELAVGRPSALKPFESGIVIKAKDLKAPEAAPQAASATAPRVTAYTPAELIGKRIARPAVLATAAAAPTAQAAQVAKSPQQASAESVESLKENLKSLNDLQARLRFMLKELEELIKE